MKFTTAQVLSAATDFLVCDMGGVYEILGFLTGHSLFTHQLPSAAHQCRPHLEAQFPWLKDIDVNGCSSETWKTWLAGIEAKVGMEHEIEAMPAGSFQTKGVFGDLIELRNR